MACTSANSCFSSSCVSSNGSCGVTPVSCDDGNPCTIDSCIGSGPSPVCVHTLNQCNNSDLCNPQYCNTTSGTCYTVPVDCNYNNPCIIDSCSDGVCSHTPMQCSYSNPCLPESCSNGMSEKDCLHKRVSLQTILFALYNKIPFYLICITQL